MNILQILPELNVGGVETGTLDMAKELVKHGHKAIVISNGGSLVKTLESYGAKHYSRPVHRKSIFTIVKMAKEVKRILEFEKIDILHARSRVPALIGFFACRKTPTKFVTTCHGFYSDHLFSRVMGWGKFVIVPSRLIGRHMIDDFGVPYERIRLIPRGVDLERFKFIKPQELKKKKEIIIGMIGRITPLKGHAHFIKAISHVVKIIPHIKVWIVGDAPPNRVGYLEELKILLRRLSLDGCVEFLGRRSDIPQILSKMDLLVLSSISEEAFGRVILEAAASGVPIVATRAGAVMEIIEDGKEGILVPPEDPKTLAEAMIKVLKNEPLAKSLADAAKIKVEKEFTLAKMVEATIRVYEEAKNSFRILVIKLSALGDVILSIPSLCAIREKFPNAHICVLVGAKQAQALKGCPYLNELIVCDFKTKDRGLRGLFNLAKRLQRLSFDCTVDLQNNRRSHILSYLSFAPKRFGYDNGKFSFLLNYKVKETPEPLMPLDHQLRTLMLLGIQSIEQRLELWPSEEEDESIRNLLSKNWIPEEQVLVGINPGASSRWVTKLWPKEYFAKTCDELEARGMRVVLTGTQEDTILNQEIRSLASSKPIDLSGKTNFLELACLIRRCRVFLTSDSAPLHIAAAMGTPFIALFGPTNPQRHLPPAKNYAVIKKDLPCSPCYKPHCGNIRCMKEIAVEEVLEAIERLLK